MDDKGTQANAMQVSMNGRPGQRKRKRGSPAAFAPPGDSGKWNVGRWNELWRNGLSCVGVKNP